MHNQGGEITNILGNTFVIFDFSYTFKLLLKIIGRNNVVKIAYKEHRIEVISEDKNQKCC